MAVYFEPRDRYYGGFWGNLGNAAAGIVTNLVGQQIGAMFDRAAKAKQVEAQRAVMGTLGDTSGMDEEQMLMGMASNPQWAKMSAEDKQQAMLMAKLRGQNYGGDMYRRGLIGSGFTDANADATLGSLRAGFDAGNIGKVFDRVIPELKQETVDDGSTISSFQRNPFQPGIVSGSMAQFTKSASPEAQMQNTLGLKQLENAMKIAQLNADTQKSVAGMNVAAAREGRKPYNTIVKTTSGYGLLNPLNGQIMPLPGVIDPLATKQTQPKVDITGLSKYREQLQSQIESMSKPKTPQEIAQLNMLIDTRNRIDLGLVSSMIGMMGLPADQQSSAAPPNREATIARMMEGGATREQAEQTYDKKYGRN